MHWWSQNVEWNSSKSTKTWYCQFNSFRCNSAKCLMNNQLELWVKCKYLKCKSIAEISENVKQSFEGLWAACDSIIAHVCTFELLLITVTILDCNRRKHTKYMASLPYTLAQCLSNVHVQFRFKLSVKNPTEFKIDNGREVYSFSSPTIRDTNIW